MLRALLWCAAILAAQAGWKLALWPKLPPYFVRLY